MPAKQQHHNRIFIIMGVLLVAGSALALRLVQWQVIEHDYFEIQAEEQNHKEVEIKPIRGSIYDNAGHLLAGDSVRFEVTASPNLISDPQETTDRLYRPLNVSRETLFNALSSGKMWVSLTRNASYEAGKTIQDWDITGIVVEAQAKRAYPEDELAAHLLGFVNDNSDGFYGLEGYYDHILQGVPGTQKGEHGPFGDIIPMGDFQITPATEGAELHLTINRAVQQMVQDELQRAISDYGAESGTIAVMDPQTGQLLASASLPAYSPNRFTEADQTYFLDPLVSNVYEPGSVFKIVTMAAALDSGTVTPGTTVYDGGSVEIGGQTIYNSDRQAYGSVDMTTVLAKSLNTGTSQIAMAMGPDTFYNYLRRFGFGRLTEIDLSNESPGTLTTNTDTGWYQSALATNSFGQGIATTPIQVLSAIAVVANNGLLMKPYVVQKIVMHNAENPVVNFEPQVVRRAVSADTADILTQMLVSALETENSPALIPGYKVAGKTGTAEIPVPGGYHPYLTITSFGGFFPADDPQVAVLVILNKPTVSKWGTQTAAPTFKRVGERLISLMEIPPDTVRLAQR